MKRILALALLFAAAVGFGLQTSAETAEPTAVSPTELAMTVEPLTVNTPDVSFLTDGAAVIPADGLTETLDGVTYTLAGDGVLTISGSGTVGSMDTAELLVNLLGWTAYIDAIVEIDVQDGITGICSGAFQQMSGLTKVTIADSVTAMGANIFYNSPSITEVSLPASQYDIAVAAVREALMNRTTNIRVSMYTTGSSSALCEAVFDEAISHTGVSNGGDYLLYHMSQYTLGYGKIGNGTMTEAVLVYSVVYHSNAEQEAAVDARLPELYRELRLDAMESDEEIIHTIYQYLCENVAYDYDNLRDDTYKLKLTAYAALIDHTAVCQGYANLFYRMALDHGIDARIIIGYTTEAHAWNIVEIDGVYYDLDATAGATSGDPEAYYLRGDSTEAFAGHIENEEYTTSAFQAAYPLSGTDYVGSAIPSGGVSGSFRGSSYALSADGTLTITGSGALDGEGASIYDQPALRPYKRQIKRTVVGEGITDISTAAFENVLLGIVYTFPQSHLQNAADTMGSQMKAGQPEITVTVLSTSNDGAGIAQTLFSLVGETDKANVTGYSLSDHDIDMGGFYQYTFTYTVTYAETSVFGDINGDGQFNALDAYALLTLMFGRSYENSAADLNGDAEVDAYDLAAMFMEKAS